MITNGTVRHQDVKVVQAFARQLKAAGVSESAALIRVRAAWARSWAGHPAATSQHALAQWEAFQRVVASVYQG